MTDPQHILFARGGALGDFLVTLPSIQIVRKTFPAARIELLAHPACGKFAASLGLVDAWRSLEAGPLSAWFAEAFHPDEAWRQWFGGFDVVISWLSDNAAIFQRNVRQCGAREFWQGISKARMPGDYASAQFGRVIRDKLSVAVPPVAELRPLIPGQRGTIPALAVHPGSGSVRKNWPPAQWLDLLSQLHDSHPQLHLHIFSGEAEENWIASFVGKLPFPRAQVRHSHAAPLLESACALTQCLGFLGHDSGFAHLAAACGLPSLVLFGLGDPSVWAPPVETCHIVRAIGALADLPVREVMLQALPLVSAWCASGEQRLDNVPVDIC